MRTHRCQSTGRPARAADNPRPPEQEGGRRWLATALVWLSAAGVSAAAPPEGDGPSTGPPADDLPAAAIREFRAGAPGEEPFGAAVAFSPDGTRFASAVGGNRCRVWDRATGAPLRDYRGHRGPVMNLAFAPDGKRIASCGADDTIQLWDAATGAELCQCRGHVGRVFCPRFSPDGKTLASGGGDGTVRLWGADTGKELRQFHGHLGYVCSVKFSPDGTTLASGGQDGTVRLWDAATGKELRRVRGTLPVVWSVAFSPDGKTIAYGGLGRWVRVLDLAGGTERSLDRGRDTLTYAVAFSPDGHTVAAGGESGLQLWEVRTGLRRMELTATSALRLDWSPDGAGLASTDGDGLATIWRRFGALPERAGEAAPEQMAAWWAALADDEADPAYAALGHLAARPTQALAWVRQRARAATMAAPGRAALAEAVRQLDSDRFDDREAAAGRLARWGEAARAALVKVREEKPSPEVRRRLDELLGSLDRPRGEDLRLLRVLELLEAIGGPDARGVVERLGQGDDRHRVTRESRGLLARWRGRPGP